MLKNKFFGLVIILTTIIIINACKKQEGGSLGAAPKADFVAVPQATNPNNLTLVNKSSTASIPYWKIDNATSLLSGDSAKINLIFPRNYQITMYVFGQGGMDSVKKTITISQIDPTACVNSKLGFITSCTSKTWKLDPTSGAYKVGPNPNDGSWWSSGTGDVSARSCEFNDEYTFFFNNSQTFAYDNKGDFFGDGYLGDNSGTCQPSSNYTAAQKDWGSNANFKWDFLPNAGVNKLGQLTVIGSGAHIGLQKVRNGAEVTTGPAQSITYDILDETHNPAGYDLLTLGVAISGGWWTFRLRSF